jgi:hypothetical protein
VSFTTPAGREQFLAVDPALTHVPVRIKRSRA